jgi:large subunit ribosomal protein L25
MADVVVLRARRRAVLGKKVRFLRREGLVPASLYGPGVEPAALQLTGRDLDAALRQMTATTLAALEVEGESMRRVLVREVQRHPVTERTLHVDFFAMPMDVTIRADVPVQTVGEAPAVTVLGGTLVRSVETVQVEALPTDLPERFEVDLSGLTEFHHAIHARDLVLPAGVSLLTPPDTALVAVLPARVEAGDVAAEAAEGAEAATEATPAPEGDEATAPTAEAEGGAPE